MDPYYMFNKRVNLVDFNDSQKIFNSAPTHLKSEFSLKVAKILESQENCEKSRKSCHSKNFFPLFLIFQEFLGKARNSPYKRLCDY